MTRFFEMIEQYSGAIIFICALILTMSYSFINIHTLASPKVFKGYYLNTQATGGVVWYKVMIDWDNRIDEIAFASLDKLETLTVYRNLTE